MRTSRKILFDQARPQLDGVFPLQRVDNSIHSLLWQTMIFLRGKLDHYGTAGLMLGVTLYWPLEQLFRGLVFDMVMALVSGYKSGLSHLLLVGVKFCDNSGEPMCISAF